MTVTAYFTISSLLQTYNDFSLALHISPQIEFWDNIIHLSSNNVRTTLLKIGSDVWFHLNYYLEFISHSIPVSNVHASIQIEPQAMLC